MHGRPIGGPPGGRVGLEGCPAIKWILRMLRTRYSLAKRKAVSWEWRPGDNGHRH